MSQTSAATAADNQARRPKLVVTLGRGSKGKSVLLRYVAETSARSRPLRIVDADPSNDSLSRFFPGEAVSPQSLDEEDRRVWLEKEFWDMIERRYDMLLDVGGGDLLVKRLGAEVGLAQALEAEGIDLIAIHMLGPDLDDLHYLEDVETKGLLQPKHTVLMLNAGLVPPTSRPSAAFATVLESPIVKRVRADETNGRQVLLVVMPCLPCMRDIEAAGLPNFASALTPQGRKMIGPFNVVRVRRWLNEEMAELRNSLGDLLP